MKWIMSGVMVLLLLALPQVSRATEITLDEKTCGSRLSLSIGDMLEVRLPGNPTTGYAWEVITVPSLLQNQKEPAHRSDSQRIGAGGSTSFLFRVAAIGEGTLEMAYRRPWEKDTASLKTCRIGLSSAQDRGIQPAGKPIREDKQGSVIYQVPGNGIKIGYKLIGSGEPLVMIMGLGATMESWHPDIIQALSKNYQLILLDNRGMGFTTTNDSPFSYQLFADDVIALLDALKIKKAHVLGYSMGSTITQKLLLEYPQRFNKAVIHATATDPRNAANFMVRKAINAPPTVLRQLEATTHWKTPLEKMAAIPNQVLLVVGTADTTVGEESSQMIASAIPGAWLVQFKNATHHLMDEAPIVFSKIVLLFLETNTTVEGKR